MADNKSSLDRWLDDLHADRLPNETKRRWQQQVAQPQPKPSAPKQKPIEDYAKEVIRGFLGVQAVYDQSKTHPYVLTSKAVLPDKQVAEKVIELLTMPIKEEIARRINYLPLRVHIGSEVISSPAGNQVSFSSDDSQDFQGISWLTVQKKIAPKTGGIGTP